VKKVKWYIVSGVSGIMLLIAMPKLPENGNSQPNIISTVIVDSATYGTACNAKEGNDTENLARVCNGNPTCFFRVSNGNRPGGDPTPGCSKDYIALYHCTGDPEPRQVSHPVQDGENYQIRLSCLAKENYAPPAKGPNASTTGPAPAPARNVPFASSQPSPARNPPRNELEPPKPLPHVTHLRVATADPHICEKPENTYYGEMRSVPKPAGSGEFHNPEFLFNVKHEDNDVTWADGFTGKVYVCYVVDEKGMPGTVTFPQPPPDDIQKHIIEDIGNNRYKAGWYTTSYRDPEQHFVATQMAMEVIFP
jgi:hypothetical protein